MVKINILTIKTVKYKRAHSNFELNVFLVTAGGMEAKMSHKQVTEIGCSVTLAVRNIEHTSENM